MKKFGEEGLYEDEWQFEKSTFQIKRELLALKDLGKKLLKLLIKDIDKLNLSERLYEVFVKAQGMTTGALKRQIGTINGLMVRENYDEIKLSIDKIRQQHNGEDKQLHRFEQWRDQLLAFDADVISVLRNQFDDFDMHYVRQLVSNADKEAGQEKPPKSARMLFK